MFRVIDRQIMMRFLVLLVAIFIGQARAFSMIASRYTPSRLSTRHSDLRMSNDVATPIEVIPRRWKKSTKQLATLGPASSSFEMIEKLFLSGADIFRLNFSHGEHAEKAKVNAKMRTTSNV